MGYSELLEKSEKTGKRLKVSLKWLGKRVASMGFDITLESFQGFLEFIYFRSEA